MSKDTIVWVCGKYMGTVVTGGAQCNHWVIQGVFSSEQLAIKACVSLHHFIGPIILDGPGSEEDIPWPGAYYPKLSKKSEKESV